jgi:ABC-type multidrug transport system fused ATPase/permease subunit
MIISVICETYLTWYIGQWAVDESLQHEGYNRFAIVIFGLATIRSLCAFVRNKICSLMIFNAGNKAHAEMIKRVLFAPINLFFDVTPTGLIINRFSKDLGNMEHVFWVGKHAIVCLYDVASVIMIICLAKW